MSLGFNSREGAVTKGILRMLLEEGGMTEVQIFGSITNPGYMPDYVGFDRQSVRDALRLLVERWFVVKKEDTYCLTGLGRKYVAKQKGGNRNHAKLPVTEASADVSG